MWVEEPPLLRRMPEYRSQSKGTHTVLASVKSAYLDWVFIQKDASFISILSLAFLSTTLHLSPLLSVLLIWAPSFTSIPHLAPGNENVGWSAILPWTLASLPGLRSFWHCLPASPISTTLRKESPSLPPFRISPWSMVFLLLYFTPENRKPKEEKDGKLVMRLAATVRLE